MGGGYIAVVPEGPVPSSNLTSHLHAAMMHHSSAVWYNNNHE